MRTLKILGAALLALASCAAMAQTYPYANPTYIPAVIVPSVTVSGTGTSALVAPMNGVETAYLRIGGSPSSFSAKVEITESRDASPAWTAATVTNMSNGVQQSTISAAGLYRVNASGVAQLRLNTTAVTGTFTAAISGGLGAARVSTVPSQRYTYSSTTSAATPAATATDIMTIAGNATTTVRLHQIYCSGQATTTTASTLSLIKYSVPSTTGTFTATAVVSLDSTAPTAASTPVIYTANPVAGTAVGTLAVGKLVASVATSPAANNPVVWNFGTGLDATSTPLTLRGTGESVAISGGGATLGGGTTLNCGMVWTEE